MNYPYSTATGTIPKILTKLQSIGQPTKVDQKWMSSIGFTKPSEHRMISILKFLDFIDTKGAPTQYWAKFRSNKTGKQELGKAIKTAYHELYSIYPNAHNVSKEELNHFFTTRTKAGALALSHTVNTFTNLAKFAEFEEIGEIENSVNHIDSPKDKKESKVDQSVIPNNANFSSQLSKQFQESKNGLTINLNIQLSVPETTNEKVYDYFFESLKKHLLS